MSSDRPATKIKIPRTVWVLGFVSLLMDISSEMIHALLPLFMAGTLGATQGIFSAIVSEVAVSHLRATAFGVFNFFSGIALLVSGLVAGGLWELFGAQYCFAGGVVFAGLTLVLIPQFKSLQSCH